MNRLPFRPLIALPLLAATLLPACAPVGNGRYPSLLPRAIEKRSDAEPTVAPQVVTADPALDARIAALAKARDDGAAALGAAATRAERAAAAAKGAAAGSERWIDAQTALAELDGFRADASARLTDIEQLAITRGTDGLPDYPPLESARAAAQADSDAQGERIARLQSMLAGS